MVQFNALAVLTATSFFITGSFAATAVPPPCKQIEVQSSDKDCSILASRCPGGVTVDKLQQYNSKRPNFCTTLQPGQTVCCTPGGLPIPKPGPDGTCQTYETKAEDSCGKVVGKFGLADFDLYKFNTKTWGWNGCDPKKFWVGMRICVSEGQPPMPKTVDGTQCGPMKPGTKRINNGDLVLYNPCPLNACCNIHGFCGTTDEFCTLKPSESGAPGTSGHISGCISNCGTKILTGPPVPESNFMKIGYFESWNTGRPCLNMDVLSIDTSKYTHIHFGFVNITPDFKIDVSGAKDQFEKFVKLRGVKRIISFGGWAFSTEPGTFQILRDAVKPGNVEKFIPNIINFFNKYNLDGVDFDWEYPGAPAMEGMPAGTKADTDNYLMFLKAITPWAHGLKKTISIAAPASFWYLKQFPIKEIAEAIDYIVYMTYDLHGTWDFGNQWSTDGCKTGDCLRSHVNLTETMNSLSMITKAGAPASKVIVGVSSYGRSFRMISGCTGPMCKWAKDGIQPGRCTGTSGYLADAEIQEIIATKDGKASYDKDSASNIMTYGDQWVSYMDEKNKQERTVLYKQLGFGGTSDWAVDLQTFTPNAPQVLPEPTKPEPSKPTNGPPPPAVQTEAPIDGRARDYNKCLLYKKMRIHDSAADCKVACGPKVAQAILENRTTSMTCLSTTNEPYVENPGKLDFSFCWQNLINTSAGDHELVKVGYCHCDVSFINWMADTLMEALPAIAEVSVSNTKSKCRH
jgi:chitinase